MSDLMRNCRIVVASDIDYDNLIAEIYLGELLVAIVTREIGTEEYVVDLLGPQRDGPRVTRIELSRLLAALDDARNALSR